MAIFDDAICAGAVVVVPCPYSDRLAEKRRPAIVISAKPVHSAGYCWLLMVTSAIRDKLPDDVLISDLARAGLRVASLVRPIKIACVEPTRILRIAGHLSGHDLHALRQRFCALCGLA